eukprot:scaffold630_cov350-Pavlova_lutheri.AAC.7
MREGHGYGLHLESILLWILVHPAGSNQALASRCVPGSIRSTRLALDHPCQDRRPVRSSSSFFVLPSFRAARGVFRSDRTHRLDPPRTVLVDWTRPGIPFYSFLSIVRFFRFDPDAFPGSKGDPSSCGFWTSTPSLPLSLHHVSGRKGWAPSSHSSVFQANMEGWRHAQDDGVPKDAASFLRSVQSGRECGWGSPGKQRKTLQFTGATLRRLGLEDTWEGHSGCVNRIAWNESGTKLLSGSDDRCLRIWDYPSRGESVKINTMHRGNIFGVRFLPSTGERQVVSGAMDSTVQVHHVERVGERSDQGEREGTCSTTVFGNHAGRVKYIEVEPSNPHLFWSAAEDGLVRQYDTRVNMSEEQRTNHSYPNAVVGISPREAKCVAINPVRPHEMAVACDAPYIQILDRRKLSMGAPETYNESPTKAVLELCPPHLCKELHRPRKAYAGCTFVTYGSSGQKLVATFHADHAYSFDTTGASGRLLNSFVPSNVVTAERRRAILLEKASSLVDRNWKGDPSIAFYFAAEAWAQSEKTDWQALLLIARCLLLLRLPHVAKKTIEELRRSFPAEALQARELESRIDAAMEPNARTTSQDGGEESPSVRFSYDEDADEYSLFSGEQDGQTSFHDSPLDDLDFTHVLEKLWYSDSTRSLTQRYLGHCNVQTDIKEASFLGLSDHFVACGSDDGHAYLYEAGSGKCIAALQADEDVVNCVQAHPSDPVLATSGIESVVRIWSPAGRDESRTSQSESVLESMIESNQKRLSRGQYTLRINSNILPMLTENPQLLLRALGDRMAGDEDSENEEEVPCRVS